jgi:hypothetical protein
MRDLQLEEIGIDSLDHPNFILESEDEINGVVGNDLDGETLPEDEVTSEDVSSNGDDLAEDSEDDLPSSDEVVETEIADDEKVTE